MALSIDFGCAEASSAHRIEAPYSSLDGSCQFAQLVLETTSAFCAGLPDPVTGECAVLWPLHCLWNPGTDDRWYTPDDDVRSQAIGRGYVPEGYGPKGVGMCVILGCYESGC